MTLLPDLSEEQAEVFGLITAFLADPSPRKPYFTTHGLAGTGKTVLLSHVYKANPGAWACALSGKAADVLRKKTGMEVDTIHATFYALENEVSLGEGRQRLDFTPLHRDGDLTGRVVLVDEVSMVNEDMARDMLKTGVRIVAFGDPGQLPPVSGVQFFGKPDATLRKVHRQALESPIIRQAHWVRLGRRYSPDGDAFSVTSGATRDDLLRADALLCWKNKTRQALNGRMREYRGFTAPYPLAGEQLMCLRNAKAFGLFNGAIYELCADFKPNEHVIRLKIGGYETDVPFVKFEGMRDAVPAGEKPLTSFTYAYAMTVHKAQGSEFPKVLMIDEYSMSDYRREWLYTGITRAADSIQVVRRVAG